MGIAYEVISCSSVAPGVGGTFAAVTGDSLTVRDGVPGRSIDLIGVINKRQSSGLYTLTSPLLHDSTVGITSFCASGAPQFQMHQQSLRAQDDLSLTGSGSAVAGDIELTSLLVRYDDLPGVAGRFVDPRTLESRGVNEFSNVVTIAAGGGGGYTGSVAVSATQDLFKANTDYALLGITLPETNAISLFRVAGVDTGNLGVAIPNLPTRQEDAWNWFLTLSRWVNSPAIPVINSSNRATTMIAALADENGAPVNVTMHWVELSKGGRRG